MRRSLLLAAVALAVSASAARGLVLAPGLYDGHPPAGRVSPNNVLTRPTGRSKGIVMIVHGGAWFFVGRAALAASVADWFNRHGYTAYDVDYRSGRDSVADVVAAYDRLRRQNRHASICAYGQSAGGQLVQLLAASRASLNCVISEGGIEDIRSWVSSSKCRPASCGAIRGATDAFGGDLWQFSPVRLVRFMTQPFLAAGSTADRIVDERQQLGELQRADPAAEVMLLPGAAHPSGLSVNFTHASVTAVALRRFDRAVLALLRDTDRLRRPTG
jgi:Prolyl oligopeptidase family